MLIDGLAGIFKFVKARSDFRSFVAGTSVIAAVLFSAIPLEAGGGRERFVGEIPVPPASGKVSIDGDSAEWDLASGKFLQGGAYTKEYTARVAMCYDADALYVFIEWNGKSPMANGSNPEKAQAGRDGGDCLDLRIRTDRLFHLQGWFDSSSSKTAVKIGYGQDGTDDVKSGHEISGVRQAFKIKPDGKGYGQELGIDWKLLTSDGKPLDGDSILRVGCDLWFDGLDPEAAYKVWAEVTKGTMHEKLDARFGGLMAFSLMDGTQFADKLSMKVEQGAIATLEAKGGGESAKPAITMHEGRQLTRNTKISVMPVKTPVVVDGKLDEWDVSGEVLIAYEPELFRGRYDTRLHMMYDEMGLYVGLIWHDLKPCYNVNRPDRFPWGYDGGGALQLRLKTDMVSVIEGWYCATVRKAALKQALASPTEGWKYSMDDLQDKGAKEAFSSTDGGYCQEIFLPWAVITRDGRPLRAGDQFRWMVDAWWSGVEGPRLPFNFNGRILSRAEVVELPWKVERKEFVTVVIDNEKGERVRNLMACSPRGEGDSIGGWDGLDMDGQILPPGRYTCRSLSHTGIGWEYQMSFETPGNPPWFNEDGTGGWGSDRQPAQGVATSGEQVFIGWPAAEKGGGMVAAGLDGQRQWGMIGDFVGGHTGTCSLAADERYLYLAADIIRGAQWKGKVLSYLVCIDKKTGLRRGFTMGKQYNELMWWERSKAEHAWWWDAARTGFTPANFAMSRMNEPYKGNGANVMGVAVKDKRLYVSFFQFDKVVVLDAATAETLKEIPVRRPCGLSFDQKGRLLTVSEKSVLAIDPESGKSETVVKDHLDAPVGVCVDAAGSIYVSDWGKSMCVKVFGADGSFQRVIGKNGGRAVIGAYDPSGMLFPRQLALDKNGHLWVAEDDQFPRRVSKWDAGSGRLIKEFIGPTSTEFGTLIDPFDKTRAIGSLLTQYELDWAKKTWHPISTIWRRQALNACFGCYSRSTYPAPLRMIRKDGRSFLLGGGAMQNEAVLGELKDGVYRPLAAVGSMRNDFVEADDALRALDPAAWTSEYYPEAFRGKKKGDNFAWSDRNGDGLVDPGEVLFPSPGLKQSQFSGGWGCGIGDDLSIYFGSHIPGSGIYRLKVLGWTGCGAPIYDPNKAEKMVESVPYCYSPSLGVDREGRVIAACNAECRQWVNINPAMVGYSSDGKLLWRYPITKSPDVGTINGNAVLGPVDLPNKMGQMISLSQYHGDRMPLVTTDGFFVASVLRAEAAATTPGPDVLLGEAVEQMNQTADGKIYVINGMTERNILEITGLETIRRREASVELTQAHVDKAIAIKKGRIDADVETRTKEIVVAKTEKPFTADGKLDEWEHQSALSLGARTAVMRASVRLAYDADNLYAAYEVIRPNGFRNSGESLQQLFASGDCAGIYLGTRTSARKNPVEGDMRLLFSKIGDENTAIIYRTTVPGFKGKKIFFGSGNGNVAFDEVKKLDKAKVVIAETPTGYVLEAVVPWPELGIKPVAGMKLLGDVGVVFADSTGRNRCEHLRVFNRSPFFPDLPTEADFSTGKWGEILLK